MIELGPNLGLLIDADLGEEHYAQLCRYLRAVDALIQPAMLSVGDLLPPSVNENGDSHIVGVGATGPWAGRDNHIARYYTIGIGAPNWDFFEPKEGWSVRLLTAGSAPQIVLFSDGQWVLQPGRSVNYEISGVAYDLVAADDGNYGRATNAAAKSINVRPNSVHALPANSIFHIRNAGVGDLTLVAGSGVVINAPAGGTLVVMQHGTVSLRKVGLDEYDLMGQVVPV